MYQSPIEIIHDNMRMEIEGEVYKAVQRVGVNVDKEELTKALQYDRGQYKRGYEDGYAKAIEEFAEKICDVCCEESMTVILENRVKADVLTLDGLTEIVWEIAKELKGE